MANVFSKQRVYTCETLSQSRVDYSKAICFRSNLTFLKFKKNLTNSLSNRLVHRSQFYKSYRLLRIYYTNTLRANFCRLLPKTLEIFHLHHFDNKPFKLAFKQYQNITNFDNVLLWRGTQVNALFNIKSQVQKKRKKNIYTQHVYFLNPSKRLLFVWKWLQLFINTAVVRGIPRHFSLISGLENFICAPQDSHVVTQFKFQIYKLYLTRNV